MSAVARPSRRDFLKASALTGGGLALAFFIGRARAASSAAPMLAPNAWIHVRPDGIVTLTCPRNEMGQDVYTSLTMLLAEELAVDPRRVRIEQAGADPAYLNKLMGSQITGGSTSVRDAWEPLRRGGAVARTLLVAAAAARWNVPASQCRAENGRVFHGDRHFAYGELASAAALQPVPAEVELKPASAFEVIGKTLPRLDAADKTRGRTVFGIDVKRPGMVYAALAQCPVLGGKVTSFDGGDVAKRPGVRKVLDIGSGVAVLADHFWTAKSALADLKIEWDEGPAAKISTADIYATLEGAAQRPGAVAKNAGDVQAALARGMPIEARYTSQLLAHATLEPQNCLALVSRDGVDVWASTQFPQGAQAAAAAAAGVAPSRVRIHAQFIGGGFGRRLESDFVTQAVAIAKAMPGTPVKLIWTREDDTTHDFYRPPCIHLLRATLAGGRIDGFSYKMVSASITNRLFPGAVKDGLDGFMTEGLLDFTYDIPNFELRTVIQEVGIAVGYWRSVSNALNAFAIESFVDELAAAARTDPLAFRLAMLQPVPRQRAVLERAAARAGYGNAAPGHAYGIASMACYGTLMALVAEVSGSADAVKLEKLTYAIDCGIAVHPDQVIAQAEGGAVTGLINALRSKVTIANGRVEQANFNTFLLPRMPQVPPTDVILLESSEAPGGMGEAGVPLIAPALANAVFALSGKRIRSLPLEDGGIRFT